MAVSSLLVAVSSLSVTEGGEVVRGEDSEAQTVSSDSFGCFVSTLLFCLTKDDIVWVPMEGAMVVFRTEA